MKKLTLFIGLIAACYILLAQTEETRKLSSFTEVSSAEGIEVVLSNGSIESARVIANGIPLEDVITEVDGDELEIYLEGNNHKGVDVQVYITYVKLSALSASSASSIRVENLVEAGDEFELSASSAGSISVKLAANAVELDVSSSGEIDIEVNASEIDAEMSSAGDIYIKGSARSVEVGGSSSGEFDGYEFECDDAELRVSSGASIKITVKETLEATASSGGSIRYKGDPQHVDSSTSSGGSVRKS